MNRTSLCIKMLLLLRSRGKMKTSELAQELETNPRNIREFKKELITAGYDIQEYSGPYGGYVLNDEALFPNLRLLPKEILALKEARQLILSHPEFSMRKDFMQGLDKVIASEKDQGNLDKTYMDTFQGQLSKQEQSMIETAQNAIQCHHVVSLCYQGIKDEQEKTILIDPYEVIHYQHAYYLIGYSHERRDYRKYRFSMQRMYDLQMLDDTFLWDTNYSLSALIGKQSLFKQKMKKLTVRVQLSSVRFFKEVYWGLDLHQEEMENDYMIFSFYTDDLRGVYRQLFSFGNGITLVGPSECVEEFCQQIQSICDQYSI